MAVARSPAACDTVFPRELQHFPGFVCLALTVLTLVARGGARKARCRFWFFAALVFGVLSLGPVLKWFGAVKVESLAYGVIVLPAAIFHRMFITEGMRVYARFGVVVLFCLSVFVGCNLSALSERVGLRRRMYRATVLLLCLLALAEKSSVPMRLAPVEVPGVFSALRSVSPHGAILSVPFSHNSTFLFLQTMHEHPIVNSYVSRGDEGTRRFYEQLALFNLLKTLDDPVLASRFHDFTTSQFLNASLRQRLLDEQKHLRIDFFIVHKHYLKPDCVEALRSLFGEFMQMPVAFEDESVLIFSAVLGAEALLRVASESNSRANP
jgi:hypothetical protein